MQRLMLTTRRRALLVFSPRSRTYSFVPGPSPPKLPPAEQAEFERLQRQAAVSMAFQPQPASESTNEAATSAVKMQEDKATSAGVQADEDVNRGLRRGAPPEFRGDTNPKTGEVGGPKNDPLKWGSAGDWSYNGRVTDF